MKKQIWCIIWILSCLTMVGCGAGHGGQPEAEAVPESQIQSEEEEDSERKDSESEMIKNEEPDMVQNETTGENAPAISITPEKKEWRTDDGKTVLLKADADKVEVAGDGFEALNTALTTQWGGLTGDYEELLQIAREHYDSLDEKNYFVNYYDSETVMVSRIDNRVASFCSIYGEYTGGAHDFYAIDGATFDVKTGKKLQLEEILSDADGFYDTAVNYIIKELEENYGDGLFPEYREVVETYTFGETPMCWYLDNTGIVIEYGLYTVAPYVTGMPSVTLPYDVFDQYLKEEFTSPCSSVIARVMENEDVSRLLGEDGKVMVATVSNEEYGETEVTVVSGDSRETVGAFSRFVMGYMIKRADGRSFLVFYCDDASDDFVTYVYEVTDGKVRACDKLDGASFEGGYLGASGKFYLGTDAVGLFMRLSVFGSYAGSMTYQLTEEGKLVQTKDFYTATSPENAAVTALSRVSWCLGGV